VAVVQYTFTHKQYAEYRGRSKHNNKKREVNWEMQNVPRICELYPGICLTTEEKARKNLSSGSRKVPWYHGGSSLCARTSVIFPAVHPAGCRRTAVYWLKSKSFILVYYSGTWRNSCYYCCVEGSSQDSSAGITMKLQDGQPRNCGLDCRQKQNIFPPSEMSRLVLGPPIFLFNKYRGSFLGKATGAWS
jgi:hypothetical protein